MEVGVVGEGVDEPGVNKPGPDDPGPLGESGWSADRRAKELRARGKSSAGAWEAGALGERRVAQALTALPPDWLVLHDRLLMPGRSETNLATSSSDRRGPSSSTPRTGPARSPSTKAACSSTPSRPGATDATPRWIVSSTDCSPWPPRWLAAFRSA